MPLTSDIVESYRAPRRVVRRHLARGPREDRALMFLMLGCLLIFVAQLPRLSRAAALDTEREFAEMATPELFVWMFLAPLVFYGLAALGVGVMRLAGRSAGWAAGRLALFWAVLATAPVWLLRGLVAGFVGPGAALDSVSLIGLCILVWLWFSGLREAARPGVET